MSLLPFIVVGLCDGLLLHSTDQRVIAGSLKPIFHLHIPKCGSSFETSLAHFACGSHIPPEMTVKEPHITSLSFGGDGSTCTDIHFGTHPWKSPKCSSERWNAKCGSGSFLQFKSGHTPLPRNFPDLASDLTFAHVATFFRRPMDRIISGWYHGKHDCKHATDIVDYADCVKNCAANMLVGKQCGDRAQGTQADLQLALARVNYLGFVGLTHEWDLSICLFHAMYGGDCLPVEFSNLRPGVAHGSGDTYDLSSAGLGDYNPGNESWDFIVHDAAEEVFWKSIRKYDVRRKTCLNKYCPQAADHFTAKVDAEQSAHIDFEFDWPGRYAYDQD